MTKLSKESVLVSGDLRLPYVGLGTWQLKDNVKNGEEALLCALDSGYRHFDTAYLYENEFVIGGILNKYIDSGKCKREDLIVVTKLAPNYNHPELVEKCIKESLKNLQLDYIDLYLVHWPIGFKYVEGELFATDEKGDMLLDMETDIVAVWKAMEKQVEAGRAKSIGLSNFNINQISRILKCAKIKPANLQIELNVHFQQKELLTFCKENGISVCGYAPLGSPGLRTWTDSLGISTNKLPVLSPMEEPCVKELAAKHNKLPSQILLRFIVQLGAAVIPKSTNLGRLKANINIFDFELSDEDMNRMKALDKGPAARCFGNEILKGIERHPEYPF